MNCTKNEESVLKETTFMFLLNSFYRNNNNGIKLDHFATTKYYYKPTLFLILFFDYIPRTQRKLTF